ncbi:MAG: hypothetical protein J1F60_11410, partial [Oscillospiraceae bacterium]|nr:hypothetical protein [Oscillospiraceae bacterium]
SYDSSDINTADPDHSISDVTDDTSVTTPEPAVTNKIDWAEVSIYPEVDWERNDSELVPVTPGVGSGGMGFEGITVNDPSELSEQKGQTRWQEAAERGALPVFLNHITDNWLSQGGYFIYLSEEEMTKIAENAAYVLGTEVTSAETEYSQYIENTGDYPTQEQFEAHITMPSGVVAQCADGTEIGVSGNGRLRIELGTAVPLPKENAEEFIIQRFGDLMQFEKPTLRKEHHVGEYNFYDAKEDPVLDLLSYNMRIADFCVDNGSVYLIWIDNDYCGAEYLGDYPVITLEEAQEMLLEGKYLSTVVDERFLKNGAVSAEDIAVGELVYRCSSGHDRYFMPYYRFYAELDNSWLAEPYDSELTYGAFYVPAVSEEYLSDLTVWDGSFN